MDFQFNALRIHNTISIISFRVFSSVILIGFPPVLGSIKAPETMRSISGFSIPKPAKDFGIAKLSFNSSTNLQNPSNPSDMPR